MAVDYTITIGSILEVLVLGTGGVITVAMLKQGVKDMKVEITGIQKEVKEMGKAVIQIAVQNSRLDRIEEDVRELRHGRGLIVDDPLRRGAKE